MAQAPAKMGTHPAQTEPGVKCPSEAKEGLEIKNNAPRNGHNQRRHTLVGALQPALDGVGRVSDTEHRGGLGGGDTDDASGHFRAD